MKQLHFELFFMQPHVSLVFVSQQGNCFAREEQSGKRRARAKRYPWETQKRTKRCLWEISPSHQQKKRRKPFEIDANNLEHLQQN